MMSPSPKKVLISTHVMHSIRRYAKLPTTTLMLEVFLCKIKHDKTLKSFRQKVHVYKSTKNVQVSVVSETISQEFPFTVKFFFLFTVREYV